MIWCDCVEASAVSAGLHGDLGAGRGPEVAAGPQGVGVEALPVGHVPDAVAAVPKWTVTHVVRVPRQDPDRHALEPPVADLERDQPPVHLVQLVRIAGLVEVAGHFVGEAERLGGVGAEDRGVVPDELGQRLGEFLQPGVIREPAVPPGGSGLKTISQRHRRTAGDAGLVDGPAAFALSSGRRRPGTSPARFCKRCPRSPRG